MAGRSMSGRHGILVPLQLIAVLAAVDLVLHGNQEWLNERAEQWIHITTKKREVEFIPAAWSKMLPPIGKRKTFEPEHWMTVRLRAGNVRLRLMVVICPTTDAAKRTRAIERLLKDKAEFGFSIRKKELTEDWTRILSEEICELPEDEDPDVDDIMPRVERRLTEFLRQTAKVPAAMSALFSS